jgi:hypothetical protein
MICATGDQRPIARRDFAAQMTSSILAARRKLHSVVSLGVAARVQPL